VVSKVFLNIKASSGSSGKMNNSLPENSIRIAGSYQSIHIPDLGLAKTLKNINKELNA
jgi:hypothetical protein